MMTREQLQQIRAIVYDAYCEGDTEAGALLVVIDAELAKPEQELFAWATFDGEGSYDLRLYEDNENYLDEYRKMNGDKYAGWVIPLYTAPVATPQREWQGLTKDEINNCAGAEIYPSTWAMAFARAIESKLKEKNYG